MEGFSKKAILENLDGRVLKNGPFKRTLVEGLSKEGFQHRV
jgi:hypothetical protein